MKITVTYGSKSPKTETFDVKDSTTVEELKDKIHKACERELARIPPVSPPHPHPALTS